MALQPRNLFGPHVFTSQVKYIILGKECNHIREIPCIQISAYSGATTDIITKFRFLIFATTVHSYHQFATAHHEYYGLCSLVRFSYSAQFRIHELELAT